MPGHLDNGERPRPVGGSYAFDEATMRSLITQWDELADSYRLSIANARVMGQVVGPGNDIASQAYATAANSSADSYLDYVTENEQYCRTQAQLFRDALNEYLTTEDANTDNLKNAGSESPQPGN